MAFMSRLLSIISPTRGLLPPCRASEERAAPSQEGYTAQLAAIPQFAALGPLFKSSPPVELTETESEYMVRCVKHVFQVRLGIAIMY